MKKISTVMAATAATIKAGIVFLAVLFLMGMQPRLQLQVILIPLQG